MLNPVVLNPQHRFQLVAGLLVFILWILFTLPLALAQVPDLEQCSIPGTPVGSDAPSITDVITITDSITIAELHVAVDITHTFIGDLGVSLEHDGTTVVVHDGNGGADDDLIVTFGDSGAKVGTEAFNCSCLVRPIGPGVLADFMGATSTGDWTLSIVDYFPDSDDGMLNNWCLRFYSSTPPAPPPPVGNLLCSSQDGTGVIQAFWSNGAAYDEIQIQINGQISNIIPGSTFIYSSVPLSVPSYAELQVQGVKNGVLSAPRTCAVSLQPIVDLEVCTSPGTVVSELVPVLSNIVVADDIAIGDLQVSVDITHSFIGDLLIDLTAPNQTTVRLHDGNGGDSDDLKVTFWHLGQANGSEAYDCDCEIQPAGPGSMLDFIGGQSAGNWLLSVVDQFAFDSGELRGWCLRFFKNTPVFGVLDLHCELGDTPGSAELSWVNAAAYDAIEIYVNGQLESTLSGPFVKFEKSIYTTVATSSPQVVNICVIPISAGNSGLQQCCSLFVAPKPIENLSTISAGGTGQAILNWTNPIAYDTIDIYLKGIFLRTVAGTTNSVIESGFSIPSDQEFCLVGIVTGFGEAAESCTSVMIQPTAEVEVCSTPNSIITDLNTPTIDSIFVTDTRLILDLELSVNITHSFIGDLDVDLYSPSGTQVQLHDQMGAGNNNLFLIYSDSGLNSPAQNYSCGCAVAPIGSLADFRNESPEGEWSLVVTDNLALDDGVLNRWCLRILENCEVPPPTLLSCEVLGGDTTVSWSNRQAYDSIEVLRDDIVIATLPGSATSYVDTTPAGEYRYQVVAFQAPATCGAPSLECRVAFGITDLIYAGEFPALVDSVSELKNSLLALGLVPLVITDINAETLTPPESSISCIWVQLGSFPANSALSSEQGILLAERATGDIGLDGSIDQAPIPIYIEGGDVWGFDAPTAFADYDGVDNNFIDDGDDSLFGLSGLNSQLGPDFSSGLWTAFYQQDSLGNDFTDRLLPATEDLGGSASALIWQESVEEYGVGVFYASTAAFVISCSFEFGGYTGDRNALAAEYRSALLGDIPPPAESDFLRGDWNDNGDILIGDPITALDYIFNGGVALQCSDAADANDDGMIDLGDPISLLSYIFAGGPAPPAPSQSICGPDPTFDNLPPCQFESCP